MAEPVLSDMLHREEGCTHITVERKYYHIEGTDAEHDTYVKRSLRPSEWQTNPFGGTVYIPRLGNERILNEVACMRFIAKHTDIPVPKVYACFEDDGAVYLVRERVEGVTMDVLDAGKRKVVEAELEKHLQTMKALRSSAWGGPSGLVVPPYRLLAKTYRPWVMKRRPTEDLVFCHNDLSTHNVIVDPQTLKVKAIVDWEYAGFFPAEFEGMFFRRPGPSVALEGEVDDEMKLLAIMRANREEEMD
ncbi:hypothetical protein MAPG_10873 [Magnaporthiopsis poae ATCC 64411]|uniref:Aminoglycoside phosphotransferase domain-containing protein n=1 Tax=Magnaporthiopsis poae (strain ATCC 64411 / 73-15) TaxID=644358 RepID=A0A0C4EDR5_MAGP6|nr:hypothetical protein MAPG_10873 [Magnaporthiopsis poae ATCC 64411]